MADPLVARGQKVSVAGCARSNPGRAVRACLIFLLTLLLALSAPPVSAQEAARLKVVFSGDTLGELEPCGCPGTPLGGFARRATQLKKLKASDSPLLVLDTGNALLAGALTQGEVPRNLKERGLEVARLMGLVGTSAAAVGGQDLWAVGYEALRSVARESRVSWLSANLKRRSGELAFPPSRLFSLGGLRIGVLGLSDVQELVLQREGLERLDPVHSALEQVALLQPQTDLIILLSNLGPEDLSRVRLLVKGIDVILMAARGSERGGLLGNTLPSVIKVPGQGHYLYGLELRLSGPRQLPLRKSGALERRLNDISATRLKLERFRAQMLEELGRIDEARFAAETAFLQANLEKLLKEPGAEGIGRFFALEEYPLDDTLSEEPNIAARVRRFLATPPAGNR